MHGYSGVGNGRALFITLGNGPKSKEDIPILFQVDLDAVRVIEARVRSTPPRTKVSGHCRLIADL